MRGALRRLLKIAIYPVVRYFGPRFQNVHTRLDEVNHHLSLLSRLADRQNDLDNRLAALEQHLREYERRMSVDFDTILEVLIMHQRSSSTIESRMDEILEHLRSGAVLQSHEEPGTQPEPGKQPVPGTPAEEAGALLRSLRSGRSEEGGDSAHPSQTSVRSTNV